MRQFSVDTTLDTSKHEGGAETERLQQSGLKQILEIRDGFL